MPDLEAFVAAVVRHWILLMGGVASVVMGMVFSASVPPWAFWTTGAICVFAAFFFAWRDTDRARRAAESRLEPRLAFEGVTASHDGVYHRVFVKNLSGITQTFGIRMVAADPPIGPSPLPYPLQITHHDGLLTADIPGGDKMPVDVFRLHGQGMIRIEGVSHKERIPAIRREFTLNAFTINGASVYRKFVADFVGSEVKFWAL